MFVPAMQVLEYVSPQALEEWEEQMEQELDEERAKLEEEAAQKIPPKKKRGRPPAHSQIEAAVVAEPEPEGQVWPKKGVMSITTPTTAGLEKYETLSDEEGTPSRQLERELLEEAAGGVIDGAVDELDLTEYQTAPEESQDEVMLDSLHEDRLHAPGERGHASRTTLMSFLQTESFASTATSSGRSTPVSSTAGRPVKKPRPPKLLTARKRVEAQSRLGEGSSHVIQGRPSFTAAGYEPSTSGSGLEGSSVREGVSKMPGKKESTSKVKAPKPKPRPKKEKTPKANTELPPEEAAEPVWEVKRIEDVEMYEVEGRGLVRYFKVRWEGDWPPEQNPSWEPEDNLPANLVRNYLKRPKKRPPATTPTPKTKKLKQTTLSWSNGKQYKSVSEAFEGEADNGEVDLPELPDAAENRDEDQEELFVVDKSEKRPRLSWNGGDMANVELGMFSMYR